MEKCEIPYHVGIIMDGNGRWAKERGLKRNVGHLKGYNNFKRLVEHVFNSGVKILSVFAFSTENFKRSAEEVEALMDLFIKGFKDLNKSCKDKNLKIIFSGRRDKLRSDVLSAMDEVTRNTCNNTDGILNICINYGGCAEIVDTTKKLIQMVKNNQLDLEDINEEVFKHNLYQDLPSLDLIIRTSGELRLSGFMLYNSAYSEYYFTKVYFPDFTDKEFDKALDEYKNRNRRFGK